MSVRHRSGPRRSRGPAGVLVAGLLPTLLLASSASAQAPLATILTAADARRAGLELAVIHHPAGAADLLEVVAPAATGAGVPRDDFLPDAEAGRRSAMRLLDVAPDGTLALADAPADPAAGLSLVAPGGAVVHVALAGVAGATFAPDGRWVAAVDASGVAWRIDPRTGSASTVADGPFGGSVAFDRDGALLLVAVSSVEAPYAAELLRVDPESGAASPIDLPGAGLVFSARRLPDGALAVALHPVGGGVEVRRVADGATSVLAELDPLATDVSISPTASAIAYAVAGRGSYLWTDGGTVPLGAGELPRVAPDGGSVALLRSGGTVLLDAAGRQLDAFASSLAGWLPCGEGCAP